MAALAESFREKFVRVKRGWDFLHVLLGLCSKRVYSAALHLAVMHGRLNNIRVLLTECSVDAEAFNLRWVCMAQSWWSLMPHVSFTCMLQTWPLGHTISLWYPGIFLVEKYFLESLLLPIICPLIYPATQSLGNSISFVHDGYGRYIPNFSNLFYQRPVTTAHFGTVWQRKCSSHLWALLRVHAWVSSR